MSLPPEMTMWPWCVFTARFLQRFQKTKHMPQAGFGRLPVDEVTDARVRQSNYIRYVLLHLFHGRAIEHAPCLLIGCQEQNRAADGFQHGDPIDAVEPQSRQE